MDLYNSDNDDIIGWWVEVTAGMSDSQVYISEVFDNFGGCLSHYKDIGYMFSTETKYESHRKMILPIYRRCQTEYYNSVMDEIYNRREVQLDLLLGLK
ncbi:MAG: hypothetical protein QNK23_00980 [Crocinitomicaceae bacterium]|nr:hypothetical protein [Crocinitomicaceae bacterium]